MTEVVKTKDPLKPVLPIEPEPSHWVKTAMEDVQVEPSFNHIEFQIEDYLKTTFGFKLDTDDQICTDFLSPQGCPRPLGTCPYRHTKPSARNFRPPSPTPFSAHARTVCKHWLRGLCKKGSACEFLHEYNLRKMPECWHFSKFGFCGAGDECMYLHIGPRERRPECKAYTKGFCPAGPTCPYKHIKRVACPLYLTGFCPQGENCDYAHPPFEADDLHRMFSEEQLKRRRDKEMGLDNIAMADPGDGGAGGDGKGGRRRDLSTVLCFKCGNKGHYASMCTNPAVPGSRGGVERGPGGKVYTRQG